MKQILLLFLISTISISIQSQEVKLDFAINFGNYLPDLGNMIESDQSGNIYTVGYFQDTVDFDPSASVSNEISNGLTDIYVQKLDSNGNLLWVNSFGGRDFDIARALEIDVKGDILITGFIRDTVDFDPSTAVNNLIADGTTDIFILKLNSSGDLLWAKSIKNSLGAGSSIESDLNGNIYVTGFFQDTADFDPDTSVSNLIPNGEGDIFILKLDSSGNFIWAKGLGSTGFDEGRSITVDKNNIYVTGDYIGNVDFDPGSGTSFLPSFSGINSFIQKLDLNGNLLWVNGVLGSGSEGGYKVELDRNSNVYSTGSFEGTVDFDLGAGVRNLTSNGLSDIFIQKLDSAGNFVWAQSMGSSGEDRGLSITTDSSSNVYTTGYFEVTVNFNTDPTGLRNLTSNGKADIFIQKLDKDGSFIWAESFGASEIDQGRSIYLDENENIFTTGIFERWVDFDPDTNGTKTLASNGFSDIFIMKLNQCFDTFDSISVTSCKPYLSPSGKLWIQSGLYLDTIQNAKGCDSLLTINLSIIAIDSTISIKACDSYTWIDGITYTSSNNTATDTLTNASGCDSIVSLNLTINNTTFYSDSIIACDSYTWIDSITYTSSNTTATDTLINAAGCDSIITLNLTIKNSTSYTDAQVGCNSFTWIDGVTYTSDNNTALDTLTNAAGCDSIITLDLTILDVDTAVFFSQDTLVSNATDASYQWLDCNNNFAPISGATEQKFLPNQGGSYAVVVTENNCTDTSSCYISTVGFNENGINKLISIYPNPTNDRINIKTSEVNITQVVLLDIRGAVIREINQNARSIDISQLDNGIYYLRIISSKKETAVKRIVKL
ncbi:MAG: T9SS type A sorting domain-containing protein [Vicingaceae bacterium]